jgi:atypical dual specificity phosphatase
MARPDGPDDFHWLRVQGIQLLIVLTEFPPHRPWLDDAGLLGLHVPVPDFHAPTPEQLEQCVGAIRRAKEQSMGVAVHCMAGLGRTGTVLAAYLTSEGMSAPDAIARVRQLRPGSIESDEQEEAVIAYAERRAATPPP